MPPHSSGQSRDSLLNGSRDTSYICNTTFNRVGPSPGVVTPMTATALLDRISSVDDLRRVSEGDLQKLASELRTATIGAVSKTGGYLGAGLVVRCLSLPDAMLDHGSQSGQLALAGLDKTGIAATLRDLTGTAAASPKAETQSKSRDGAVRSR